jgi:hypothetical protein
VNDSLTSVGFTDTTIVQDVAGNNPGKFYGPVASGSGGNAWTITVVDTTGGGSTAVSRAMVAVYDLTGSLEGALFTGTSGTADFTVDLDSFTVVVTKAGSGLVQSDIGDTLVVAVSGQTDTVFVTFTDVSISPPGTVDEATLFLYFYNGSVPEKGVYLRIENHGVISDSVNGVILGRFVAGDFTDSTGRVAISVPCSYQYNDSLRAGYDISLRTNRGQIIHQWPDFWVGDTDTVRLVVE